MRIRRSVAVVLVAVTLIAAGCSSGDTDERRILVDFSHDEFATFVAQNFPITVTVSQGQTIEFRQTWTGEPHTVTGGTAFEKGLTGGARWLEFFESYDALLRADDSVPNPEGPDFGQLTVPEFIGKLKASRATRQRDRLFAAWNALRKAGASLPDLDNPPAGPVSELDRVVSEESDAAFEGLLFAGDESGFTQNLGQPCYLRTGMPPEEPDKPCTKAEQRQPEFDGQHSVYNSGILPYDGPRGNSYKIKLADDIEPGTYAFYCAIHGPAQRSEIRVVERGESIPSQSAVSREARQQINESLEPLEELYRDAVRRNRTEVGGETVRGPFSGLGSDTLHGSINEFIPRTLRVKAREPITWKIIGAAHTISFDVPAFVPIIEFDSTEGVRFNPQTQEPAGGAPPLPEEEESEEGEDEEPEVTKIDGGTYDGDGFWSSGLVGGFPYAEYTVRIAKPGTYDYACLIHPPMVGKIVVT